MDKNQIVSGRRGFQKLKIVAFIHLKLKTILKRYFLKFDFFFYRNLLNTIITYECKQTQGTTSVEGMIKYLLSLLTSEVSAHVKTSEQYFTLLYNYCSQVSTSFCSHTYARTRAHMHTYMRMARPSIYNHWSHILPLEILISSSPNSNFGSYKINSRFPTKVSNHPIYIRHEEKAPILQ